MAASLVAERLDKKKKMNDRGVLAVESMTPDGGGVLEIELPEDDAKVGGVVGERRWFLRPWIFLASARWKLALHRSSSSSAQEDTRMAAIIGEIGPERYVLQ